MVLSEHGLPSMSCNESRLAIVCPHCPAITPHTLALLSNTGQSEHSTMLLLSHLISFHRETYRARENEEDKHYSN